MPFVSWHAYRFPLKDPLSPLSHFCILSHLDAVH